MIMFSFLAFNVYCIDTGWNTYRPTLMVEILNDLNVALLSFLLPLFLGRTHSLKGSYTG
jgi:hypothetical protein